jgi:hypothetical protein
MPVVDLTSSTLRVRVEDRRALRDRRLLRASALGSSSAWEQLVDAHCAHVWVVLRSAGLQGADAAAASEAVWARLAESLPLLQQPSLVRWLHDTARAEARRATALATARPGTQATG